MFQRSATTPVHAGVCGRTYTAHPGSSEINPEMLETLQ